MQRDATLKRDSPVLYGSPTEQPIIHSDAISTQFWMVDIAIKKVTTMGSVMIGIVNTRIVN